MLVGFAAETQNLIENARDKLARKNLDFIVANNLNEEGSGFGYDTNLVTILDSEGNTTQLSPMTKEQVAGEVWDRVEILLAGREK